MFVILQPSPYLDNGVTIQDKNNLPKKKLEMASLIKSAWSTKTTYMKTKDTEYRSTNTIGYVHFYIRKKRDGVVPGGRRFFFSGWHFFSSVAMHADFFSRLCCAKIYFSLFYTFASSTTPHFMLQSIHFHPVLYKVIYFHLILGQVIHFQNPPPASHPFSKSNGRPITES